MTNPAADFAAENHPIAAYLKAASDFNRQRQGRQGDYAYSGVEDFVLRHGQSWTVGDKPKGVRLRTPKHCFANAYKLVTSATGERLKLRYVEGYASGIIPMQHAWAVTPEGVVVETTWRAGVGNAYYGVAFPMEVVDAAIFCSGHWGVLDDWQHDYPLLREPYTDPKATAHRLYTLAQFKEGR